MSWARGQFRFGRGQRRLPLAEAMNLWAAEWQRHDLDYELDIGRPDLLTDLSLEGERFVPDGRLNALS